MEVGRIVTGPVEVEEILKSSSYSTNSSSLMVTLKQSEVLIGVPAENTSGKSFSCSKSSASKVKDNDNTIIHVQLQY